MSDTEIGGYRIKVTNPIGSLYHEPTKCMIAVYSRIGWFKRLMLKWCFALRFIKNDIEK